MAARLTPAYQTFNTANGSSPLAGGKIHFYVSGSVSTNKDTFSDDTLLTANTNPLVLDSAGRVQVDVWGDGAYKMVVADSTDTPIDTFDPITGSIFQQSVNTIASLTALLKANLTSGDEIYVSGYYAQGDGGGGRFVWDSTSTATANGGVVIASDEGGSGRWNRVFDNDLTSLMFGATGDGTTDDTNFLQAGIDYAVANNTTFMLTTPLVSYSVTTLLAVGNNFEITTQPNVIIAQRSGTGSGVAILGVKGHDIRIGDLIGTGNITTDVDEQNHFVGVGNGDANTYNVSFGNLHGENIRGDVLSVVGRAVEQTRTVFFDTITGTNIYRVLLSVIGGDVQGKAVISNGTIGYRDITLEPNAPVGVAAFQPGSLHIDYYRGGLMSVVSADSNISNTNVSFGIMEMDNARISDSTPAYVTPHGLIPIPLAITSCERFHADYLKMRDYNFAPVWMPNVNSFKGVYTFGRVDIANCSKLDTTNNVYFSGSGGGSMSYLEIDDLIVDLFSVDKLVIRDFTGAINIKRATVTGGGAFAADCSDLQLDNSSVDAVGATAALFAACPGARIKNTDFTNVTGRNLATGSAGISFENVTGTFGSLFATDTTNVHVVNCTLNGIRYFDDWLTSNASLNKAGTATFAAGTTITVTLIETEGDANYHILVSGVSNVTLWVTSKTTTTFVINASSSNSDTVSWSMFRIL
jgi:hypothetical protein